MKFSELDGKRIALWGLGRETIAFREQLSARLPGATISATIDDDTPEQEARAAIAQADVLVRSPGVSIYKPLIQEARARRHDRHHRNRPCGWPSAAAGT